MTGQFQYDVFLSHNVKDKGRVRRLAHFSQASTFNHQPTGVWFDEWLIKTADSFALQILEFAIPAGLERNTVLFRDPSNASRRFIPQLCQRSSRGNNVANAEKYDTIPLCLKLKSKFS